VRTSPFTAPRSRLEVRRLREADRPSTMALLNTEPGASMFLRGNLETLGLRTDYARYWGLFTNGRLGAVLMMVDQRAAFFAPAGSDIRPLAEVAIGQGMEFTMGRSDLVDATLAANPALAVERREDHILAELAPGRPRRMVYPAPAGVLVRQAGRADLEALTGLYQGAAGFEDLATDQIRRIMTGRISVLRTFLAQAGEHIVAAASTSAETNQSAMIGGVWTAANWRGRGISTAVVSALAHDLLAAGRLPFLFYLGDNAPAARVYAKLGFRSIGQWTVMYFERRETA
jgi:hypothetical protein